MQKKINNKETFRGRKVSNLLTLQLIFVRFCQNLEKEMWKIIKNMKKVLANSIGVVIN